MKVAASGSAWSSSRTKRAGPRWGMRLATRGGGSVSGKAAYHEGTAARDAFPPTDLEAKGGGLGSPDHDELERILGHQGLAEAHATQRAEDRSRALDLARSLKGQLEMRDAGEDRVSGEVPAQDRALGLEPEERPVPPRLVGRSQERQAFEARHKRGSYPRLWLPGGS